MKNNKKNYVKRQKLIFINISYIPTYEVVIVYFLILEAIIKSIYTENITLNLGLHFHQKQ